MRTRNVKAKTMRSRRSDPGSCCGFWYSGKVQLPSFTTGFHHRIVSARRQRMTTQNSRKRHPSPPQSAITSNRFHRVFGTGRHITTGCREHRRNRPFVSSQQLQHDEFGTFTHDWLSDALPRPGFRLLLSPAFKDLVAIFCPMTAKAFCTSSSNCVNPAVKTDFFGLITTSAAKPDSVRDNRTASRRRRLMRLRCTAPPSARPTVNPMRSPGVTAGVDKPAVSGRTPFSARRGK